MAYIPIVQAREKKMSKEELLNVLMDVVEKISETAPSSEIEKPYEVTLVIQHWLP